MIQVNRNVFLLYLYRSNKKLVLTFTVKRNHVMRLLKWFIVMWTNNRESFNYNAWLLRVTVPRTAPNEQIYSRIWFRIFKLHIEKFEINAVRIFSWWNPIYRFDSTRRHPFSVYKLPWFVSFIKAQILPMRLKEQNHTVFPVFRLPGERTTKKNIQCQYLSWWE